MHDISEFNEVQQSVVNWQNCPLLVVGGGGKKHFLSHLIAQIFEVEYPKRKFNVLGLIHSDITREVIQRDIEKLIPDYRNRVRLQTFHSLSVAKLRQHASHITLKPNFTVISDELDRQKLLDEAIAKVEEIHKIKVSNLGITSKKLLPLFTVISEQNVAHDRVEEFLKNWVPSNHEIITQINLHFRRLMFVYLNFDIPNIMFEGLTLMTVSYGASSIITDYYPFICVDDFHKITHSQYHFIKQVIAEKTSLILTANEKQLVERRNGECVDRLLELQQDYGLNVCRLPETGNCPYDIAQISSKLANSWFQKSAKVKSDTSQLSMETPSNIKFHQFDDLTSELDWVASSIAAIDNDSRKKCVVITKSKRLLEKINKTLNESGIDSCLPVGRTKFDSPQLAWFDAVLRLANSNTNTDYLAKVCQNFHTLCGINLKVEEIAAYAVLEDENYLQSWAHAVIRNEHASSDTRDMIEKSLVPDLMERQDYLKFNEYAFQWLNELAISKLFAGNELENYEYEREFWNELIMQFSDEDEKQGKPLIHLVGELNLQKINTNQPFGAIPCYPLCDIEGRGYEYIYVVGMAEVIEPASGLGTKTNSEYNLLDLAERLNYAKAFSLTEKSLNLSCSKEMHGKQFKPSKLISEMGLIGDR